MTDERTAPPQGTDETEQSQEPRRPTDRDDDRSPTSEEESNPLLREGPDAPDAADIEDPDEQL